MNKLKNHFLSQWKLVCASLLIAVFILVNSNLSNAQEVLTNLTINPVVAIKYSERNKSLVKAQFILADTLSLPFLDDFSKESIYPDGNLWLDSSVYINRDYPISPPTIGVATFDGVSKSGAPYDTLTASGGSGLSADTLTSKPINLVGLPADSSVMLSFFWQAKGRGNDPESSDTLLLDFFNPTLKKWKTIWYQKGFNPSTADSAFRLTKISIVDTAYLKTAFQFRFRNKATITGNVDHWHIDYVYLDKNRNTADTIFSDVAFAYNSPSLLKNYYAMPWKQYQASEMKTTVGLLIRNNDNVVKNTSFNYQIKNNLGGLEASYSGGSNNCDPYATNGLWNYAPISNPPIGNNVPGPGLTAYTYPALTDTASFSVEYTLNTTPDKNRWNDTLRFKQNFYNYYAYDDGTAEAGYGLNLFGAQIAYKFNLNVPDTLVAVQMLFNWIPPKVSSRQFRIRIWNDAGGSPGALIYEDSLVSPKYQYQFHDDWGNLTNMYYPYKLTSPIKLSGSFFVGLIQYCCNGNNELLNIGYDKNTNSSSKIYYNIGSGWSQSTLSTKGSLMIRPVFGDMMGLTAINENDISSHVITLYPNPTNGLLTLISENTIKDVEIYNMTGEKVYEAANISKIQTTIDISHQPNGVYFLRAIGDKNWVKSQKVILSK